MIDLKPNVRREPTLDELSSGMLELLNSTEGIEKLSRASESFLKTRLREVSRMHSILPPGPIKEDSG